MADRDTPEGSNTGTARQISVVDTEQAWAAVDAMPPPILAVLHHAPFDIDPIEILDFVREARRHGWPDTSIVVEVRKSIADAARNCAPDWGPGYPATRFTPIMARPGRPCRRMRQILR